MRPSKSPGPEKSNDRCWKENRHVFSAHNRHGRGKNLRAIPWWGNGAGPLPWIGRNRGRKPFLEIGTAGSAPGRTYRLYGFNPRRDRNGKGTDRPRYSSEIEPRLAPVYPRELRCDSAVSDRRRTLRP